MTRAPEVSANRAGDRRENGGGRPFVSVIIPVRDNPEGVRDVLACLSAQTLTADRFEIIIGDDGSRPDLVPRVSSADGRVRVVEGPPRTSYAARNAAAATAEGAILAFCDSDCLPQPRWLEEAIAALADADVVAGEVTFYTPESPNVWSLLTIDMFLDQERNVSLSRGVTANLVLRRSLFQELGGFDDSLPSGGDYAFVKKAVDHGARLHYSAQAIVRHPTLNSARAFLGKIWQTNRADGRRRARERQPLDPLGALILVPLIGALLARRQALRPLWRLYRPRLRKAAVRCTWRDEVRALALLYSVVSYAGGLGRAVGWLEGLRAIRWQPPLPTDGTSGKTDGPKRAPTGSTTWS